MIKMLAQLLKKRLRRVIRDNYINMASCDVNPPESQLIFI
jgi:hypothetical protein